MGAGSAGDEAEPERRRKLAEFAKRAAYPTISEIVDAGAVEVMAALERAGVPFLLLKGPALARYLYREDERRPYIDVDLLVPVRLRDAAGDVLGKLGYVNATALTGVEEFTGAIHAETWESETRMPVDLHWKLAGWRAPPEHVWERLWATRQPVVVAGHEAPVPGVEGLALHLATHAAQHGPDDLKAIGDLVRGVERWPLEQWGAAAELAGALDATTAFAAGLRLCTEGSRLAGELALPEAAEAAWLIRNRRARPRGTFHLEALRGATHPRERATVIVRSLFPSPAWIRREYPAARRGPVQLLAAYGRHLARTPGWALRAWKYRRRAERAGGR